MGTSELTARPTIIWAPGLMSIVCSPDVLTSLNASMPKKVSGTCKYDPRLGGPLAAGRIAPGQRDGPKCSRGFVLALGQLGGRVRVGDDPRAGLDQDAVLLYYARPDGDCCIEAMRAPSDVPDRARVGSAPGPLDAVQQLHGADLRRAGDRARRETRLERVHGVEAVPERAAHFGDDVLDVRVALEREVFDEAHRSVRGDASDVVAAQVHQHLVLGELLGIGEQLLRERGIRFRRGAARA